MGSLFSVQTNCRPGDKIQTNSKFQASDLTNGPLAYCDSSGRTNLLADFPSINQTHESGLLHSDHLKFWCLRFGICLYLVSCILVLKIKPHAN